MRLVQQLPPFFPPMGALRSLDRPERFLLAITIP
jgi:hypothetical protein